ncbi:MAG: hypothetical protein ABI325_04240 [Ginsengibacter sp.]
MVIIKDVLKKIFNRLKVTTTILIIFFLLLTSLTGHTQVGQDANTNTSTFFSNLPPQPGEDTWHFIEDLKAPMWTKHSWKGTHPGKEFANFSNGVRVKKGFKDSGKYLSTAYDDLHQFFKAGNVLSEKGAYTIETKQVTGLDEEEFKVEIDQNRCRILSSSIEGIRRGIFYIEDQMLTLNGPFLPVGTFEQKPIIKRRISRCAFAPIKLPPKMEDELMDDVDYYPDNYLNRLAHEGVNGMWIRVVFQELTTTTITPDAGQDAEKRLAKLQRVVDKCLRYGIRTYLFCIEPKALQPDDPILKQYPELAGASRHGLVSFCPSSETGKQYLYESVNNIFKSVPDLGGIINITHGERATTCLSTVAATENIDSEHPINCPRCSKIEPWQILHQALSAMEKGMHEASPKAELISWLYMPQPQQFYPGDPYNLGNWVYTIPGNTPKGVILQFNFTSGVTRTDFGKLLVGGDYWLAATGPSPRFERVADSARKVGTQISAKIQTSNAHDLSTVPFVPVPSILYKRFSEMRRLGVSHTMLSWYSGNYPGLMNKAAGMLSFEPFSISEDNFLNKLASIYWRQEDISKVIKAWKFFSEGYENYPLTNLFQYYGPMHDGTVWPLLLKPMDMPLSPTWLLRYGSGAPLPPSGDRVGESFAGVLTLDEVVELCRRMSTMWDKGMEIFNEIEPHYKDQPERILDIGVAKALRIQFNSAYNILHFYALREKMIRMEGTERLNVLKELVEIIQKELDNDQHLIELCKTDSRLGFHSETEGYKYFPEKIRWRMQQLKSVLANDVPEVEKMILDDKLLFPEFTGKKPTGAVANAVHSDRIEDVINSISGLQWQKFHYGSDKIKSQWTSVYNADSLYIIVSDIGDDKSVNNISEITLRIEPRRLWPSRQFTFDKRKESTQKKVRVIDQDGKIYSIAAIPFKSFWWDEEKPHPVRIDVRVKKGSAESAWRPSNPLISRLILGTGNPADLGWLLFSK